MKQKLMNSAISLWHEKGYDSVSISEICRSCGVTTGGFYYYFSSKSALLDDYFQELCGRRQAQALKKSMIETSCIEKIWLLLEVCSEAAVELGADLVRVMVCNQGNMADSSDRNNAYLGADVYELILAACSYGQQTGEIRDDEEAESLMNDVIAVLTGVMLYWGASGQGFDLLALQHKTLRQLLDVHGRTA